MENVWIGEMDPGHPLWGALRDFMIGSDDWRWISEGDEVRDGIIILAAVAGQRPVGHLSLMLQPLDVPDTGAGERPIESFVSTFGVDPDWRRRGVGTALQEAALERSRELGCWQMRSWSSRDRTANYHLKMRLGFCFCPAFEIHGDRRIEGGYFVQRLKR